VTAGVPPTTLGNYQIIRQLGRDSLGTVYLARQVGLDRPVALLVLHPELAQDLGFLVGFTRQACAALGLVHPNLVQVHDVGSDHGLHYVSMEFVAGQSLAQQRTAKRKLPAEEAAACILQAARGLKFAHERGLIHCAVKLDNILVSDQGVVKVADLGLVRPPGREEPALAAPEQGRDPRGDVYSLGCALHVLVIGRSVMKSTSAGQTGESVVRPHLIDKDVPRALSGIIVKMVADRPEDRYASMAEVIRALEDFLRIESAAGLAQSEPYSRTLKEAVRAFYQAGPATVRAPVLLGFFGSCAALLVLLVLVGAWRWAGGVLGLGLLTAAAYFVVHGLTQRSHLFLKARDLVLSSGWRELINVAIGLLLLGGVLWLFGLVGAWLLEALLAVALAVGFWWAVDRRIAAGRVAALEKARSLLVTLRLRGLSEETLHEFVYRSAEPWEEFFEALFGYEARLAARIAHASVPGGAARPRFAAWRDPVVRWLDHHLKARHHARLRRYLESVEQAYLTAQATASARAAAAIAQATAAVRQETAGAAPVAAPTGPPRRVQIEDAGERPSYALRGSAHRSRLVPDLLEGLLGGGVRFLLGAVLLMIALFWLYRRDLLPDSSNVEEWDWRQVWYEGQTARPLAVPGVPPVVLQALCSVGAIAAGLVLVVSSLWRSWRLGLLTLLGAAVMLVGPVSGHVPAVESLGALPLCLAAGGILVAMGFLFGRDT
jgi:hypothetical protein